LVHNQHTVKNWLENVPQNLYFAGDGLFRSSLEASFNTGVQAAKQIIKKMGKKKRNKKRA